jgi:hypothetical protein
MLGASGIEVAHSLCLRNFFTRVPGLAQASLIITTFLYYIVNSVYNTTLAEVLRTMRLAAAANASAAARLYSPLLC